MIVVCMHQNIMGIFPTLVFDHLVNPTKTKHKIEWGSTSINTREPKVFISLNNKPRALTNKHKLTKMMANEPKLNLVPN